MDEEKMDNNGYIIGYLLHKFEKDSEYNKALTRLDIARSLYKEYVYSECLGLPPPLREKIVECLFVKADIDSFINEPTFKLQYQALRGRREKMIKELRDLDKESNIPLFRDS